METGVNKHILKVSIVTLLANFIACASRLSAKDDLSHAVGDFIGSLICLIVLIPALFIVYFTLYRSVRYKNLNLLVYIINLPSIITQR